MERQRNYKYAISALHQYFLNESPLISLIKEEDLQDLPRWLRETYKKKNGESLKQNTATTWLCMIGAIFVHAHKRMKILSANPLPERFRGAFFKDENKQILSEDDCLKIKQLDDSLLPNTLKVAKYCMVFQYLTGIDYCDLETLGREHIKYDSKAKQWSIRKEREKTKQLFRVPLSPPAKPFSFRVGLIKHIHGISCRLLMETYQAWDKTVVGECHYMNLLRDWDEFW